MRLTMVAPRAFVWTFAGHNRGVCMLQQMAACKASAAAGTSPCRLLRYWVVTEENDRISISGLVAEYIVAIDVTRVRFPADAASAGTCAHAVMIHCQLPIVELTCLLIHTWTLYSYVSIAFISHDACVRRRHVV